MNTDVKKNEISSSGVPFVSFMKQEIAKLNFEERQNFLEELLGFEISELPNETIAGVAKTTNNKLSKVKAQKPFTKKNIVEGERKKWVISLDVPTSLFIQIESLSRKNGLSKQKFILKILKEIIEKKTNGQ